MRLIDADELITAFPCGESVRTESVRATINHMPTIEVSEDCISREQVRAELDYISYAEKDPISIAKRIVDNAPSVVPSGAEGEWIGTEYDGYADGNPVFYEWICSACKCVVEDEEPTWNYCPNCGAKMKGAEK